MRKDGKGSPVVCTHLPIMETAILWHRALNDPQLHHLPYKIETNEHGQLVLSPHKPQHGLQQGHHVRLLIQHARASGEVAVEFAVETQKGIKGPGVVWIPEDRLEQFPDDAEASPVVSEIVVEVLSKGNTESALPEKRDLYLDDGAQEVRTCGADGTIPLNDDGGKIASSLMPTFPNQID